MERKENVLNEQDMNQNLKAYSSVGRIDGGHGNKIKYNIKQQNEVSNRLYQPLKRNRAPRAAKK